MPNEWNKLISGGLQGAGSLVQGMYQQSDNEKSTALYDKTLQSLNDLFDKYSNQPSKEQIENQKLNNYHRINAETYDTDKYGSATVIEKQPITVQDLYKKYSDAQTQLATRYGEQGVLRAKALGEYFSQLLKSPDVKILETKDGIYSYNVSDPTNSLKMIAPFTKKEEKKVFNVGDYAKMTDEQILSLPINELEKGLSYFNDETREKIFSTFPKIKREYDMDLKQGEFSKQTGRRRSYSGKRQESESPKDRQTYNDMIEIAQDKVTDEYVNGLANQMDISPNELRNMAKEVYEGKKFKTVKNEIEGRKESVPDIIKDLGLSKLADDLYMTETDPAKGGDINRIYDLEDEAMRVINDNYDNIPEEVRSYVIRYIIKNIFNAVRKSKGLPDYEL